MNSLVFALTWWLKSFSTSALSSTQLMLPLVSPTVQTQWAAHEAEINESY